MPTPLKPGVHPEMLARRYADATGVLQNPSYRAFVDDLRRDGVLVFDPSEALAAARRSGPQYLATDTHWRPEAMEAVAELLGGFIAAHVRLPATADPGYRIERLEVRNTGDVARMLDLPDDRPLFPPEAVWLRRVLQPDGSPWRSSRDADVLVLGDSFSNIYSLESMGWGTSAGFAEQLSYTLAAAGRSPRPERRGRVRHARHAAAGSRSARRKAGGRLPVRRARAGVRRLESDSPARADVPADLAPMRRRGPGDRDNKRALIDRADHRGHSPHSEMDRDLNFGALHALLVGTGHRPRTFARRDRLCARPGDEKTATTPTKGRQELAVAC